MARKKKMPGWAVKATGAFCLVNDHPYAFGSESFDLQRNSSLTTYSGEEIETPWMIQLGFGLDELVIEEDGSIQLNDPMISLLVNDRALSFYDELYDLRRKETPICLNPYWETRYSLSSRCHPDDSEVCEELSTELEAEEERIVESWKNAGFDIWSLNNLATQPDGTYISLLEELPDYRLFNGICLLLNSGRPLNEGLDRTSVFADAIGES